MLYYWRCSGLRAQGITNKKLFAMPMLSKSVPRHHGTRMPKRGSFILRRRENLPRTIFIDILYDSVLMICRDPLCRRHPCKSGLAYLRTSRCLKRTKNSILRIVPERPPQTGTGLALGSSDLPRHARGAYLVNAYCSTYGM